MAGVDYILSKGYVDQKRLFINGGSYGGTLTAWAVGHTTRFTAAVSVAPNIDWISWSGVTDNLLSANNFLFRKPFWVDPKPWFEHSPLMYVARVKTPTLLMVGDADARTGLAQAQEFYSALKMLGVPTRLIIFQGEPHGSARPSNVMRQMLYAVAWFDKYGARPNR